MSIDYREGYSYFNERDQKGNTTWQNRADNAIGQGCLTNSKHPSCFVQGVYPTHAIRAKGITIWSQDGEPYTDFICGLGSSFLGYGNERINSAIKEWLSFHGSYSIPSFIEVQVAELFKQLFPVIERLKFLKTGSEACAASIKIARAYTRRKLVLSDGYHGMGDEFISLNPGRIDVGSHYDILPLIGNEHRIKEAAAVIIEPCVTKWDGDRIKFLQDLRDACTKHGTVLIYDEVITGIRFTKLSVSNCTGIQPDLICLGKAIGNGFPISVVGGKAELMDCADYFVSTTYAGDTISLAAAKVVLMYMNREVDLNIIWEQGEHFWNSFNTISKDIVKYEGYPTRGALIGDELKKALFLQEMCKAKVLFGVSPFFCQDHIEVKDHVLNILSDVCSKIRLGGVKLEGAMPKKAMAQRMRDK